MKTLIAMPCMDMLHTDFCRSLLSLEIFGEVQYTFAQSSLIYDARNKLCSMAEDGGFDRVLWLDSDMIVPPSMFKRMHEHLDMGKDFVSGIYFGRKPPFGPIIYKRCWHSYETRFPTPHVDPFEDYPRDSLFQIGACGFGAVMTSVKLLRAVEETYGSPFAPQAGFGEDIAFCIRAKELGAELWCDSTIKCGHVGMAVYTEDTFSASRAQIGHAGGA